MIKFLDLPGGFSYEIIGRAGETMSDGLILPGSPDGMAAFPGKGDEVVVVRNHEVSCRAALRGKEPLVGVTNF